MHVIPSFLFLAALLFQAAPLRTSVTAWVDAHQKEIVTELLDTLAIPNVAADRANIRRNADHLRALLERHGFGAELLETSGNPLVFGSMPVPGATRTILFYCHYDGQPVDPKAWKQPDPFTAGVRVSGFYDGIPPLSPEERAMLDAVPDDSAQMLGTFGVAAPERGFPRLQDALLYPTLNIRGLSSAHVGAGARTIIPDRATAALDIRLVKETRAEDLVAKLRAHVAARGYHLVDRDPDDAVRAAHPKIARLAIVDPQTNAFRTSPSDAQAHALVQAITKAFGEPPVQLRTIGGTVPIAPFIDALGFPAVLVPLVNFDNNQHEENENLRLGTFFDGIVTVAAALRM